MIEFREIGKRFSGTVALEGVNFAIERGGVYALVGENGAGKSTLMNLLAGVYPDYEGEIRVDGEPVRFRSTRDAERAGVSIIHQELNLVPDLSVAENIFLGREPTDKLGFIDFREMRRDAEAVLADFDFPHSVKTKVSTIGVGWGQIVEIAKALSLEADVILMDEPTSALSENELTRLFEKTRELKARGATIVFVSHRLKEIFEIADEAIVLRDGKYVGRRTIAQTTREELVNLMIGREFFEERRDVDLDAKPTILKAERLALKRGGAPLLRGIDFELREGEILGVAGLLGSGRTELLKFLYGEIRGEIEGALFFRGEPYSPRSAARSIRDGVSFLSEDRKVEGNFAGQTIRFNASVSVLDRFSSFGFLDEKREKSAVGELLEKLNVKMRGDKQKITELSGGNQQKVLLGRSLMSEPKLLLLDEPTRGVDVGSKQEIYDLARGLAERGVSIVAASSEIPELLMLCDRVLVLSAGEQTAILDSATADSRDVLQHAFTNV